MNAKKAAKEWISGLSDAKVMQITIAQVIKHARHLAVDLPREKRKLFQVTFNVEANMEIGRRVSQADKKRARLLRAYPQPIR